MPAGTSSTAASSPIPSRTDVSRNRSRMRRMNPFSPRSRSRISPARNASHRGGGADAARAFRLQKTWTFDDLGFVAQESCLEDAFHIVDKDELHALANLFVNVFEIAFVQRRQN